MKKLLFTSCAAALTQLAFSQQQLTSTAGGSGANVSWSLGEVVTATIDENSGAATQGFQQPDLIITAVEKPDAKLQLSIYPNPVATELQIQWGMNDQSEIRLFDAAGKEVLYSKQSEFGTTLNLANLPAGLYLLKAYQNNKENVFKITKTR